MRARALTLLFALPSFGLAANPAAVIDAANPMLQALDAAVDTKTLYVDYLPGYGLNFSSVYQGDELGEAVEQRYIGTISGIVSGLAPTVSGLEKSDYVSYALTLDDFDADTPPTYIVVRVKAGQAAEVWVDGEQQGQGGQSQ